MGFSMISFFYFCIFLNFYRRNFSINKLNLKLKVLQSIYFTLCTIAILENLICNNKETVLNRISNMIHVGLAFPLGVVSIQ